MNWLTPTTEDRAVSPVVGVALLIAIAVILAAVIGAVVLGIGVGMAEAPQASLAFEHSDDGELTIYHDGGDALDANEIVLRGDAADDDALTDDLAAGESDEVTIQNDADLEDGDELNVVWQDPNSDDESVIGTWTYNE